MRVAIKGLGVVTAAGMGREALLRALATRDFVAEIGLAHHGAPDLPVVLCRDFDPKRVLPPLVARRLDRASRLLAVACREAIHSAGNLAESKEEVGVAIGTWTAGTGPLLEILQAVVTLGPEQAPPMQFPNSVANAPASQVGILEGLSGMNCTFYEKQAGGLRAIVEASRWVEGGKLRAVLAGGVDEGHWLMAEALGRLGALPSHDKSGFILGEGAVAILLTPSPTAIPDVVAITGAGSASWPCPSHLYPQDPTPIIVSCEKALADAKVRVTEVDLVVSLANGSPLVARVEAQAFLELFGDHRPQVLGEITTRLGEGAFSSALRVAVAVQVLAGQVKPTWPVPKHLAELGFPPVLGKPHTALVTALAGGGSALAVVLQDLQEP